VTDKDREERRRNIIIKGVKIPREIGDDRRATAWAAELIKNKLDVEARVLGCRESGAVVVVRLEDEETKKMVMRNKNRLKGEKIFIENDLSWEDRNVQGRINWWVKEQRRKGMEVKVGIGRVRVKGIWWAWGDRKGRKEERTREAEGGKGGTEG